jgi:hypothetical protein
MIIVNDIIKMLKTTKTLVDELQATDQDTNEERARKYAEVLMWIETSIMMLGMGKDTELKYRFTPFD